MTARRIPHEAISASAGSGKTFQLAHRYIRLLASGVKPDRIIALTFSRKAAREIFDSIVRYLCRAAGSPDEACQTAERIGKPALRQEDFLKLLRELLDNLHRLHVGTMDSFIIGVIRAFPIELGIPTSFQVMDSDGAAAKAARQEVMTRIFNTRSVDHNAKHDFLEAFRQATYGQEEKGLQRSLDMFVGEYRTYYQMLASQKAWGQEKMIWPGGSAWLAEAGDVKDTADELKSLLDPNKMSPSALARWTAFLQAVRTFGVGSPWAKSIEYLFEKLADDLEGLRNGNASINIERKHYDLSAEQSRLALELLTHIMRTELVTCLERTRGIYRVLRQYENLYDETVRLRGKLTFTDAQHLLTVANIDSGGALLSRTSGQEARLYIDYRLDCKLDHWLLDEFQDTSDVQWEVLRNLADEILQDSSGQRSFFYVGDVKQAIYGWRGGNARLFNKILEQYREQIKERRLRTSFRSSQPVIDAVNLVFGHLPQDWLPSPAVRDWEGMWEEHQCQQGFVPQKGYVALLEPQRQREEDKPTDEDKYRVIAHLLKEVDPLSRGLSVAILVRTNDKGKEIVNFLRREVQDIKIVHEGRGAIEDNPVVALLLSLVRFAAHPGDTFAWRHLQMSPLRKCFALNGLDRNSLPLALLQEIQADGLQTLIRNWGSQLDQAHPLDDFGLKRLQDLVNAAGEFDVSGSHDCNEFLRFIDNYELHELAADDVVRVMTLHQSKGLGFDIVILPDLQGRNISSAGQVDFVTARDPDTNRPQWALKMPRRTVAQRDPTLAAQLEARDEAACFDSLCVLYVGMTRAKQGLYMIANPASKGARALTTAAFVKVQLAGEPNPAEGAQIAIDGEKVTCLYETGERQWYTGVSPREQLAKSEELRLPEDFLQRPSRRRRLVRVSPSSPIDHDQSADELFANAFYEELDFGSAVHELFEKVRWIEGTDIETLIREVQAATALKTELIDRAAESFRQTLESPEIRQALSRPPGNIDLWREKRFEIILGNQWVTGAFDRVVIERDEEGKVLRATIIDFKSDAITSEDKLAAIAAKYHSQLALYGKALSQMLSLDPSKITLRLVFTHVGKVHDLR